KNRARNFPLLSEDWWPRHQKDIAKPPFWSGRGGDNLEHPTKKNSGFRSQNHQRIYSNCHTSCIDSDFLSIRHDRDFTGWYLPVALAESGNGEDHGDKLSLSLKVFPINRFRKVC